jgi:hypothetical protein
MSGSRLTEIPRSSFSRIAMYHSRVLSLPRVSKKFKQLEEEIDISDVSVEDLEEAVITGNIRYVKQAADKMYPFKYKVSSSFTDRFCKELNLRKHEPAADMRHVYGSQDVLIMSLYLMVFKIPCHEYDNTSYYFLRLIVDLMIPINILAKYLLEHIDFPISHINFMIYAGFKRGLTGEALKYIIDVLIYLTRSRSPNSNKLIVAVLIYLIDNESFPRAKPSNTVEIYNALLLNGLVNKNGVVEAIQSIYDEYVYYINIDIEDVNFVPDIIDPDIAETIFDLISLDEIKYRLIRPDSQNPQEYMTKSEIYDMYYSGPNGHGD